jgi:hypothetical protein
MPDSEDFNSQKDINRYLQQQGRAPQSHMDWEMWRKTGQPGTYQAPPGSPSTFRGVRGGGGGPNYDTGVNHYNMFTGLNDTIEKTVGGVGKWAANKLKGSRDGKMDKDKSGSTASSRNGSDMADDGLMGPPVAGGGRSQNASITSPASSRGMRRGRRGDFSGALASHGITMVQGNDNYGTVYGNMGGANVGNGDYDNSFQSKNSGGRQTAFSGNNNTFNVGGSTTPPFGPPTPPTPPPPPPTPPVGPTPPPTPPVKPKTPKTYVTDEDWEGPKRPPLTPTPPPQIGAPPVGPQTPVQGPQQPGRPAIEAGPQPAGAIGSGNGQGTKDAERESKITGLATGGATQGERDAAGTALNNRGIQSNVNPAAQRGAGDTAPPMLAGYGNMDDSGPQAPAPGKFKPQNDYMGIPTGASPSMTARAGAKVKGDQTGALPQFARMAQASFAGGQPSAVQKSAGANSKPAPAKKAAAPKAAAKTVEGPKSVASKAPAKKAAAKTKEKK